MKKAPTHSEARQTNSQHFRGYSSCERTERYFFNGLQIQLNKNWPKWVFLRRKERKSKLVLQHATATVEGRGTLEPLPPPRGPPYAETCLIACLLYTSDAADE